MDCQRVCRVASGAVVCGFAASGGAEVVLTLLISLALRRTPRPPRWLCYLGCFVGTAGVLTALPTLAFFKDAFGIVGIIWFAGVGRWLLVLARDS